LIAEYQRTRQPTTDDADRDARKVGVSTRQLQRLVKNHRI